jgi:hypothetical protein
MLEKLLDNPNHLHDERQIGRIERIERGGNIDRREVDGSIA